MKRLLFRVFLLGLVLMLILTGCGGGGGGKKKPGSSEPPALSPAAVNLIPNSNFNKDIMGNGLDYLGNWHSWHYSPAELAVLARTEDSDFDGHCLYFWAKNCGTEEGHQSFGPWRNSGSNPYIVRLKTGKTYSVSLKVKSSKPGKIKVKLEDPVTHEKLGEQEITTTTEVKTYDKIKINVINGREAQFSIKMGYAINNETGFYFDDIQLWEHHPEHGDLGLPLIYNGDFESDITGHVESAWGNWFPYYIPLTERIFELAKDVPGFEGNCLQFWANNCGQETWDIGFGPYEMFQQAIFRLKSGKAYFISMKVKSDKPGKFRVVLEDPATIENISSHEITSSNEVKKYTAFLTYGNDRNAQIIIYMGNIKGSTIKNDGVNFYFDDIELLEQ